MIKFDLPLPTVKIGGKYKNLSLNVYRNAHHFALSTAKKEYAYYIQLKARPFRRERLGKVKMIYTLYCKTNRRRDLANFCCIIDKFVCDVLTKMKIIEDDSTEFIPEIEYKYGGIGEDKVTIEINEIKNSN